jgi:hypothetical protein
MGQQCENNLSHVRVLHMSWLSSVWETSLGTVVVIRSLKIGSLQSLGINGSLFSDAIKDSKGGSRYSFIKQQILCQTTAIRFLFCS